MKFTLCDDTLSDLLSTEKIIKKYAKQNNINIDIESHNHPTAPYPFDTEKHFPDMGNDP